MYSSTVDDDEQLVDTAYISSAPPDNDTHSSSSSSSSSSPSTSRATSCDEGLRESISPIPSAITSIIIRQVAKAESPGFDKQCNATPIAKPRLSKIRAQQRLQKQQEITFHPATFIPSNQIDHSPQKEKDILIMNNLMQQSNGSSLKCISLSESKQDDVPGDVKQISIIQCSSENSPKQEPPKYAPSNVKRVSISSENATEHECESPHVYNEQSVKSQTDPAASRTVNTTAKYNVTLQDSSQQFNPKLVPFNSNTSSETSYETCGTNSFFLDQPSQGQDISASSFISKSLFVSPLSCYLNIPEL